MYTCSFEEQNVTPGNMMHYVHQSQFKQSYRFMTVEDPLLKVSEQRLQGARSVQRRQQRPDDCCRHQDGQGNVNSCRQEKTKTLNTIYRLEKFY